MAANTNVSTKKQSSNISFKDSIKTKLISVLLAVAAIPLIIAVVVSYSTSTRKAKADALDLLESDAKVVEGKFSTLVQQNILALQTCASAQSTIDFIKSPNNEQAKETILRQLDDINANINDGNNNTILSVPSGDQLARADRKDSTNTSDRAYFQECLATKNVVASEIVVSKAN